jgi:hypothetical protein
MVQMLSHLSRLLVSSQRIFDRRETSDSHFLDPPWVEELPRRLEPTIVYTLLHFLFGILQLPHWEQVIARGTGKGNDIFVEDLIRKVADVKVGVLLYALLTVNI